jgi:hypothetical protein
VARYDARSRDAWATDDFDDVDLTPDDPGLDDNLDPFDDIAAPPVRGSSAGTRRHPDRRAAQRERKPDATTARSKARREPAVADIDELDEMDLDESPLPRQRDRKRVEVSEGFKCRHCRNFIGIPPSGGRNRNHCPLCLYSLHVDGKTPGDRASECRSLMRPIGVFYRPKGEQMVVHKCLGCDFVRYNRIAADDNPIVLAELPVLDPPGPDATWSHGE